MASRFQQRHDEAIATFKQSEYCHQVQQRLALFYLRGQDVDPDYLQEAGILNKIYEFKSEIQVINLLGFTLNRPMAEFELPAHEIERQMRSGNFCFVKEEARRELSNVVKKMKTFHFELIPLAVVPADRKRSFDTVLIKVYKTTWNQSYEYVDLSGRVYEHFPQFLETNKLPPAILCYPKANQAIRFTGNNELEIDCSIVGTKNAAKGALDVLVGAVGAVGSVGAIVATGGMAAPMLALSCGSALYGTGRCVEKLIDAKTHGMSLNPLEDAEARNNWLMVSANLLTFASIGAGMTLAANAEKLGATTAGRLLVANRVLRGVSAGVNVLTVVDSIAYTVKNWNTMSIYEKISLACAVCFCFREIISFANAERLIRKSQIDGMCRFFGSCTEGALSMSSTFVNSVKRMFETDDALLETGLKLVRQLIQDNFEISVDSEFTVIRLFGYEFKMRTILSMPQAELAKFLFMIQGIAQTFKDAFSLLRSFVGDQPIASAVFKRADELGGNRADYGRAINELLQVFTLVKKITNDITILTEGRLNIGQGHSFTIASAFKIFIRTSNVKSISLVKALVELNSREAVKMNNLRASRGSEEAALFQWISSKSNGSDEMLVKMRFLLQVNELCTEKSLRITDLYISESTIEIESLIRVGPEMFFQAIHPSYLIDPKFLHICQPALACHREKLESIWKKACLSPQPLDKAFEKLVALESAFQKFPFSVENVISYAISTQQCTEFYQFFYHCFFALNALEKQIRENGGDEAAANAYLFPSADTNESLLRSKFNDLIRKAEELNLAGYQTVDGVSFSDDPSQQLLEVVKSLGAREALRFGPVENAVIHLDTLPMLRNSRIGEIGKYNRFIARKRFDREEVLAADQTGSKWMVYLANEQLQIAVGVVRGGGAYLDTISFTRAN